ncbi:MAG: trypsin-like peptidase domain-containing protein [Acidobacteria bacterium]|nr:trypsin-like peptidase domain-containing protein [Acidobacteriota bacterium]
MNEPDDQPVAYADSPPPSNTRQADPWTMILGILGGVLLGTGVTFAILGFVGVFEEPPPPTVPPAPTLTAPPPTGPPPTLGGTVTATAVAQRVIPSTVYVETSSFLTDGSGSGVIYGSDGYIITNHHVIAGATEVSVTFADGARFPARVIGSDPVTDIAVLLVDRADMTAVEIGSSASLSIGEPAVAIGNPLGLEGGPTVTSGIISALNRSLNVAGSEFLYGLVQTDAPIAPGSSGGALVDARARLIGITTAIAVSDVGAEGLGFAIPIDLVVGVVTDLIENGKVDHAMLGIRGSTVWAIQGEAEYPVGVGITGMSGGSAYESSGGQINDVIVEIADNRVDTIEELLAILRSLRANDIVDIRILRADDELLLEVELGKLE